MSKMCFVSLCLIEPSFSPEITFEFPSHNSIAIKCNRVKIWNGEEGVYKAEIIYNGKLYKFSEEVKDCQFTFPNLHYLTTYNVKVFKSCLISFSMCHVCQNCSL